MCEWASDYDTVLHFLSYKLSALVSPSTIVAAHTRLPYRCLCRSFAHSKIPNHLRCSCCFSSWLCSVFAVVIAIACSSLVEFIKQIILTCIPYYISAISFLVSKHFLSLPCWHPLQARMDLCVYAMCMHMCNIDVWHCLCSFSQLQTFSVLSLLAMSLFSIPYTKIHCVQMHIWMAENDRAT